MKTIEIADAIKPLAEFARDASNEPVLVTRHGKPLAAVISVEDSDYESLSLGTNPRFLDLLAKSRARLKKEGGISVHEMYKHLGLKQRVITTKKKFPVRRTGNLVNRKRTSA